MEITVGKTSGFCFGVNRAVETVNNLLDAGKRVCTLGEIIHNPYVVDELKNRGVLVVNSLSEVPRDYTLVIRSHGCCKCDMDYIIENNINYVDATCPFVKKIHNVVSDNRGNKKILLAAGNADHPEMMGIRSYFNGKSYVFTDENDLKFMIDNNVINDKSSIVLIAQTTFSKEKWKKYIKEYLEDFTNITIHDTICNTTNYRQTEAEKLSKTSDLMIVVGGKNSSNTHKLYDICKNKTKTLWIESPEELKYDFCKQYSRIGIISGASTPMRLVDKIKKLLEEYYED